MEIRWLETFAAAARCDTMSTAAAQLGYAPSTVTLHVKHLERAVGASLFDRRRPNRPLTTAGHVLLRHAELILHELLVARTEITKLRSAEQARRSPLAGA